MSVATGLVVAATGWGWAQLHPGLDLQMDYPGNRLLAEAGLQWPEDWLDETSVDGGYGAGVIVSGIGAGAPSPIQRIARTIRSAASGLAIRITCTAIIRSRRG